VLEEKFPHSTYIAQKNPIKLSTIRVILLKAAESNYQLTPNNWEIAGYLKEVLELRKCYTRRT
jgi:hypothetical protein